MRSWICALSVPCLLLSNPLSFQQAWDLVLQNNHSIKASSIAVEKSEKLNDANTMLYLPRISLSAGYAYLGSPVELDVKKGFEDIVSDLPSGILSSINGVTNAIAQKLKPLELSNQHLVSASIKILYPLYMGGSIKAANELGKLTLKDSKEALRLKKLSTFEKLANIYYGVLLNQEVLHTLQSVEEGHKVHLENAKKLKKAGQIAHIEVLAAQVAYERAKNDRLKAQDSLEVAELALKTILSDTQTSYTPNAKLTIKHDGKQLAFEPILKSTLDSYPVLNMVKIKEEQAKEATKIVQSKFIPHFMLFGDYTYHETNSILGSSIPSWFVGVRASMPLLDNTGSYQKFQASKIAQLEVAQLKAQAKKDISLLVEKTYKEAIHAKEFYETLNSSISLAEENLKLQEEAFKQGMATSTQVVDARNTLSKAKIEQQSVAYKYILCVAKLMALSDSIADFDQY